MWECCSVSEDNLKMKGFTDRYEKQQTWSEEDVYYLSKLEKIIDIDPIVETLQSRCICDCEMYDNSDVKLAFVRWFKAKIDHMVNDIGYAVELEAKVFKENLPQL